MSEPVKTKSVQNRREVHYANYDELLSDIRTLSEQGVDHLGNWTLGQIVGHLAKTFSVQVEGTDFKPPWYFGLPLRLSSRVRLILKNRMLTKPLDSGFQIPKRFRKNLVAEADIDEQEAIAQLHAVVQRCNEENKVHLHAWLGKLTREEWTQFNLRHAELHMSFVVPKGER